MQLPTTIRNGGIAKETQRLLLLLDNSSTRIAWSGLWSSGLEVPEIPKYFFGNWAIVITLGKWFICSLPCYFFGSVLLSLQRSICSRIESISVKEEGLMSTVGVTSRLFAESLKKRFLTPPKKGKRSSNLQNLSSLIAQKLVFFPESAFYSSVWISK